MNTLHTLTGIESDLGRVSEAICEFAQDLAPAAVGAYQVCCSDETERETAEAFHHGFVRKLVPLLRADRRAAFQTVNLGARYEPGAVGIAEEHFATRASRDASKLMVVKLNSHVAVRPGPEGPEYGTLSRYGEESTCCGALAAMFAGAGLPAVAELREAFGHGEPPPIDALSDPGRVPPGHRALLAAIASAWLQARRAVQDIRDHPPASPTLFLVLPCVSVNRPAGPNTELLVGYYGVDRTGDECTIKYHGLGGDPGRYRVRHEGGRVVVEEAGADVL